MSKGEIGREPPFGYIAYYLVKWQELPAKERRAYGQIRPKQWTHDRVAEYRAMTPGQRLPYEEEQRRRDASWGDFWERERGA